MQTPTQKPEQKTDVHLFILINGLNMEMDS